MQKSTFAVAIIATSLFFSLSPVQAQAPTPATTTLVMPSGIDPSRLTFIQPAFLYTNVDGQLPGDQLGAPITGNLLLTQAFSGGGGLELHGAIPGAASTVPVIAVDLFTDYTSPLGADTLVGAPFTFTPWGVQALGAGAIPTGYTQGFRFFKQSGGANINLGEYYGLLSAVIDNPNDPTGFRDAHFGFEGFTTPQATPEPGAAALLVGIGLSVSLFALKRRRR